MRKKESATEAPTEGGDSAGGPHAAAEPRRRRGRPRTEITRDAVVDAVAALFVEGGMDAVSIVSTARKLDISRATLYRTVPTKEDLLGMLFERSTEELTELAEAVVAQNVCAADRLVALVELQVGAAIRMRRYMPVFFGGAGLPTEVFARWHVWSRDYESLWTRCVREAMGEGAIARSNPVTTTRMILGMCIWVSRWYRPGEGIDEADIVNSALSIVMPGSISGLKGNHRLGLPRRPVPDALTREAAPSNI